MKKLSTAYVKVLVLLALVIVCTFSVSANAADAQAVILQVQNSFINELVTIDDHVYAIHDDVLVRCHLTTGRTEAIAAIEPSLRSASDRYMLFNNAGQLWVLASMSEEKDLSRRAVLAPVNIVNGTVGEPRYELPGWPHSAVFARDVFYYSVITEETGDQSALHMLDTINGESHVINENSVIYIVAGEKYISYLPIKMISNGARSQPEGGNLFFIHRFDSAKSLETKTPVNATVPVFADMQDTYITMQMNVDRRLNFQLMRVDEQGKETNTFPFGSGRMPVMLAYDGYVALLATHNNGIIYMLDQDLNLLHKWEMVDACNVQLLSMDEAHVYVSQRDNSSNPAHLAYACADYREDQPDWKVLFGDSGID
ncbi:MAG TPA: hypothetical protein GXZ64_00350 [Clostridiaceae bacterium]|jgi:hypothetical protein|nr:hypothetical protein [Clostridiaceae bacterium]